MVRKRKRGEGDEPDGGVCGAGDEGVGLLGVPGGAGYLAHMPTRPSYVNTESQYIRI